MIPGAIGRGGYLTSVLGIATNGYLGGEVDTGYPQGAEIEAQAGTVTVHTVGLGTPDGAAIAAQAGTVGVKAIINIPSVGPDYPDDFVLLLQDGGFLYLEGETLDCKLLLEQVGRPTIDIASYTPSHSGLNICARSGMKAKPGQLVMDPYTGQMVLPKYVDESQPEPEQSRRDRTRGPTRPEQEDRFITTPVDKDDL